MAEKSNLACRPQQQKKKSKNHRKIEEGKQKKT
jgi:hypothetical protein